MKKKIEEGIIDEDEFIKEHKEFIDKNVARWGDEIYFEVYDNTIITYKSDRAECGRCYYGEIPYDLLVEANLEWSD